MIGHSMHIYCALLVCTRYSLADDKTRSGIMNEYNGMRRTRDNTPIRKLLFVRELITNKEKTLCRIGMERPYGTVCEHVRSADGPSVALSFNLFCLISLPSHWKVGKNKASFFYARAI
jgi:hypothetical protein